MQSGRLLSRTPRKQRCHLSQMFQITSAVRSWCAEAAALFLSNVWSPYLAIKKVLAALEGRSFQLHEPAILLFSSQFTDHGNRRRQECRTARKLRVLTFESTVLSVQDPEAEPKRLQMLKLISLFLSENHGLKLRRTDSEPLHDPSRESWRTQIEEDG